MSCKLRDADGVEYRVKAPVAVLDYKSDWAPLTNGVDGEESDWLASGETISSAVVSADTGITVDSYSLTSSDTAVLIWLSGGTAGGEYDITVVITSSAGRVEQAIFRIKVL